MDNLAEDTCEETTCGRVSPAGRFHTGTVLDEVGQP